MAGLKDQIAFITGASSGIGASCARIFAANGARLILNARRKDRLEALAGEFKRQFNTPTLILPFDVRNLEQVETAIRTLPPEWKGIDVLVNNAGLARGFNVLQEGRVEDWEEMIDSNVKGLLYVTRLVVPGMLKRGRGHIVNIASIAGIQAYPNGNVYCASKAAVRILTEGLKQDLLGTPIRVTAISPGLVQTEFSEVRFHGNKERAAKVYEGLTPLKPDDVADVILYVVTRPSHVNINEVVLMPVDQASATLVNRRQTS